MSLRDAAQKALDVMEDTRWAVADQATNEDVAAHDKAMNTLRATLADTQNWDEIEALRASLRKHMAEIKRLNECLTWEQNRAEHVGTHGPECEKWGPKHYECLLRAYNVMEERASQESRQVEPMAYVTGYSKGYATVQPVDLCLLMPVGMALYRSPPTINEMETVEPMAWLIEAYDIYYKRTLKKLVFYNPKNMQSVKITAYYTAPPKRKPLTDEQIESMWEADNTSDEDCRSLYYFKVVARAVERAHGIGGKE